jgi:RNA-directed DNA polymerase
VQAAQAYVQSGKDWVVDMDISKFFDRVNHDILLHRIGQTIRDKRVLRLIGRYLRAGAMIEGVVVASKAGRCPRCWPTCIWTHWTRNWQPGGWHSAATPPTATFM